MPQYGKLKIDQFLYNDSGTDVTLDLANIASRGANTFTGNQSLGDNVQIRLGSSDDLKVYHDGSNSYLWDTGTGDLHIMASDDLKLRSDDIHLMSYSGDETFARFIDDGAVELYYNNEKTFETTSEGSKAHGLFRVSGAEGVDGKVIIQADDGDDYDDYTRLRHSTDGYFYIENYASGSYETALRSDGNGAVELYYNNAEHFSTTSLGCKITSNGNNHGLSIYKNSNVAAFLGHIGSGDEGVLVLKDGGSDTITLNGETGTATFTGAVSDSKGDLRKIIQNTQGSTYTLVAADAGKHILASGTVTVPNSVFAAGDAVTIVNNTGSNLTITKSISTMYNSADGSSANRTLANRGMATILFVSGTVSYISGSGLS